MNVRDKRGEFVSSLQATSFRVRLNGHAVDVSSAKVADNAPRTVLVVDTSGSMASKRKVAATVYEILRSMPDETQLALVIFSDRILETVPFGRSRQETMDAVARDRQIKGLTAVRDALLYAKSLLSSSQPGDAVILLSDGGDNKSKASVEEVKKSYLSASVRLAALLFANKDPMMETEEEKSDVLELESLAEQTGGITRMLEGPDEAAVVRDLADQVTRYYLVRIPLVASHKVHFQFDVLGSKGEKRVGLSLSFPHELPSCALTR